MAFPPPEVRVADFTFGPNTASHRSRSPYNFATAAYDFMGDAWEAEITLAQSSGVASNRVLAWLASLKGPAGSFELKVFDYTGPSGITQNPTVSGAVSARAEALSVAMAPGEAFEVGEYLTIGARLHMVTAASAPVGDVQALTVWPRMRANVADGAAIEALAPYARWALANPSNTFTRRSNGARSQRLKLMEVL
ncbi:MAG: hypothetical protein ABNG97_05900 [Sulfitobacter sp.]|jgi:hypothetical protein